VCVREEHPDTRTYTYTLTNTYTRTYTYTLTLHTHTHKHIQADKDRHIYWRCVHSTTYTHAHTPQQTQRHTHAHKHTPDNIYTTHTTTTQKPQHTNTRTHAHTHTPYTAYLHIHHLPTYTYTHHIHTFPAPHAHTHTHTYTHIPGYHECVASPGGRRRWCDILLFYVFIFYFIFQNKPGHYELYVASPGERGRGHHCPRHVDRAFSQAAHFPDAQAGWRERGGQVKAEADVSDLHDVCALHWHVRERARSPTWLPALLSVQPHPPLPGHRRSPFYPLAPLSLALMRGHPVFPRGRRRWGYEEQRRGCGEVPPPALFAESPRPSQTC
jgi:hypothetical protein